MSPEGWGTIGSVFAVGLGVVTLVLTQMRHVETRLRDDIVRGDDRVSLEVKGTRVELMQHIGRLDDQLTATRTELKQDIAEVRAELKQDIAGLRTELKQDIAGLRTELNGSIERLDERVYALAAGLKPDIERASEQRGGA